MIDMIEGYKPNVDKLSQNQADMYSGSLANNTKRAYLSDLMDFFGVNELTDITIKMIKSVDVASAQQYRDKLTGEGYKPATINRKLTSMSKFYEFCCRHEINLMEYNPFSKREGVARVKQDKRFSNTRCLSKTEVNKLWKVVNDGDSLEAVRNRIIVSMLATTGMRRSEIVSIKIGDITINQGKNVVEIFGKGEKERLVVIPISVKIFIDRYVAMRGLTYQDKEKYLIVSHSQNKQGSDDKPLSDKSVYDIIKAVSEKAGIGAETISPHSLRHSYISEVLELGMNLEEVKDLVGHSDITTTSRYAKKNNMFENNPAERLADMFIINK